MPVAIPNFSFAYRRKGKPVYVPTTAGRRIGRELKAAVDESWTFPETFYHMASGGHIAALHHHRDSAHFARIDISNFFYSISRRRVQSALDRIGLKTPRFYAKWSTVLNPYADPKYALPYGFVQSPLLASLVIAQSNTGQHLSRLGPDVRVSVYMDDIALSGDDLGSLEHAFARTITVLTDDGFAVNQEKLRPPAPAIDIFNCDLSTGRTVVRDDRINAFNLAEPSREAEEAFSIYCASVEQGNQN